MRKWDAMIKMLPASKYGLSISKGGSDKKNN